MIFYDDILERLQIGPVLVVVGLQDPGNLGTILRSAEAFGSAGVVLGEGTVGPFNTKVIRASAGRFSDCPSFSPSLEVGWNRSQPSFAMVKGVRMIATSSHKRHAARSGARLTESSAVFIEVRARIPRNLMAQVDELVAIPHSPQVESLNAGVAGSIVLYEAARQRRWCLTPG
jgi:TrmH family RNA methyltransferase